MTGFFIYENWIKKSGSIHQGDCSYCNDGKGQHAIYGGKNGKWYGPYDHADTLAKAATMRSVEPCKVCKPLEPRANI